MPAATVAILALATFLLYGHRLGDSPMFLFHDEVFFGVQAHAIATTGRDTHGRLLPLYIEVVDGMWFQPAIVYFTALFFTWLPITEGTLRLPSAIVGVIDVTLMYFVARRLFRNRLLGALAAAMLALTPAHFILSHQAVDPIYPVPFVLGWLWGLLVYVDERRPAILFAATSVLGIGFYSYVAAEAMMALYLVMTGVVLAVERASWKAYAIALAGFIWPIALSIPFHLAHPEYFADILGRYGPHAGLRLNPFQQVRELLNYVNVTARVTMYFNYFNPGYLFLAGAPDIAHSTRFVGVFLLPLALFIPVGLAQAVRPPRTSAAVLCAAGFMTAPLAALAVMETGAINRESELLPFGVLLAVLGMRHLFSAPLGGWIRWVYLPCAIAGFAVAVVYGLWSGMTTGSVGGSALPLAMASAFVYAVGRVADQRRSWQPVAAALLLIGVVQFGAFYRDYFSDYRLRSAGRYEGNIRGAIEEVIRRQDVGHPSDVYMSEAYPFFESFWRFYCAVNGRDDLVVAFHKFNAATTDVGRFKEGSFIITVTGMADDDTVARRADLDEIARVKDPDERVSFVVLRKGGT